MDCGQGITEVGRLVRRIEDCRITAARYEMHLCRCTGRNADHLWRSIRRMRAIADKLEKGTS